MSQAQQASQRQTRSKTRSAIFMLVALTIPVLLLGGLEFGLRIAGIGHEREPLFIESPDQPGYMLANPRVVQRFFAVPAQAPPVSIETRFFPAEKTPGTYRIFVQGGSSAAGFPYGLGASPAGMLEQRLRRTFPERDIEVITTALAAVNSYALLDFADEIIAEQPDLVLVYAGHNEYLGVLGVGSALSVSTSRWLTLLYMKLNRLRIFQLMAKAYGSLSESDDPSMADRERDDTLMARVAGQREIPFRSRLYRSGVEQFSANIGALLDKYRAAGVPVMLATLVSNDADQPPLVSMPCADTDQETFESIVADAREALDGASTGRALAALERAVSLDDCAADAFFLLGEAHAAAGDFAAARKAYGAARDRDQLRFRAPAEFNRILVEFAEARDARLVDVRARFEQVAANGIVGADLMLEHVHPNLDGYFLLADAFYDAMREDGLIGDWQHAVPDIVARADVPVSEVDRLFGEYKILRVIAGWPFRDPPIPVEIPEPRNEIEKLARQLYDQEINWAQANDQLRKLYRIEGNQHEYTRVTLILADAFPFIAQAQYEAGTALIKAQRAPEAVAYLRRAVERAPGVTNHWLAFAHALVLTGRYDDARESLLNALALDPGNETATKALADLEKLGIGGEGGEGKKGEQ
jgi:tetratricopeptide (TPR) repeat protein